MTTYDSAASYDSAAPYDQGGGVTSYLFTPPNVTHTPPYLPETTGRARRLFRHMNPQPYGVVVYQMSDGSFVQNEATPENGNVAIPAYPLMPDQGVPNLLARAVYFTDATGYVDEQTLVDPYPIAIFYGGRTYAISAQLGTALAAYTAYGAGYSDCLEGVY